MSHLPGTRARRAPAAAVLAIAAALLTGCGADEPDASAGTTSTSSAAETTETTESSSAAGEAARAP